MAARQALLGMPEEATASVDMDGETAFLLQTPTRSLCCNAYPALPYRESHIKKALRTDN